ncbi:MAG: site-specific DNA-methyltransferase, partial [Deltaproteobacteria bacterium]
EAIFTSPKPVRYLRRIIHIGSDKDDIILDFFSGSCTTAHAVLNLNKEDNGNRKFLMVQLPEPCAENSEAFKAGYKTIADIGKERIRRVIKKIEKERDEQLDFGEPKQDLGFKVFKLDKSNFKIWDGNIANKPIQEQLELAIDHIDPNSREEDILYEILLKSGFELTTPVEKLTVAGKKVYSAAEGALLICLEKNLTKELIRAIAEKEPHRVVCLDSGFKGNDQLKTNAVQIMKSFKVESFRTV